MCLVAASNMTVCVVDLCLKHRNFGPFAKNMGKGGVVLAFQHPLLALWVKQARSCKILCESTSS